MSIDSNLLKIQKLSPKEMEKIAREEYHITYENVPCITIPMDRYVRLLEDRVRLKARKK